MPDINLLACREMTEHWYLAFTVWREARGEPDDCMAAVAWSILNRVSRPGWWGHTIDEVVTKRWQYSSLTDPKDPQLSRSWPTVGDASWRKCWEVCRNVIQGRIDNPVPGADSYHDASIAPPNWTVAARKCGMVGGLYFYDVDHDFEVAVTHP